MSFTTKIEIKGYEGEYCGECENHILPDAGDNMCGIFLKELEFIKFNTFDRWWPERKRCKECIDAENHSLEKGK